MEPQLLMGLAGIALCVMLIVWTLGSSANEKAAMRDTLRQLDEYEVENVRDQELLIPLRERTLAPFVGGLARFTRRFTPVGYMDSIRFKLLCAGKGSPEEFERFLAVKVVMVALSPLALVFAYIWNPLGVSGIMQLMLFGILAFLFLMGPDSQLSKALQARTYIMRRTLPDILDLLTISVEAGLGFEQAIDRTIDAVPGALSEEFARMLGEVRAGSSRADALRSLEQRTDVPEIRSFVLAILQADTFGVSIAKVLRSQAEEMRIRRRQMAQEQAMKAPVKMLIPMVFCVFPSLFVIIIGPAIIKIQDSF